MLQEAKNDEVTVNRRIATPNALLENNSTNSGASAILPQITKKRIYKKN